LDVGCGKGFFTYIGAKNNKFKRCFGCDIYNEFQKTEIKPFVEKVQYAEINNNILPFKKNVFDLVFSIDVIEHIENDQKFIDEKIRVCKNKGQIIIGTPNYWRIANILLKIAGRLTFPRNLGKDTYGDAIHLREYKKNDLINLLRNNNHINLESLKIFPCWYGLPPLNLGVERLPVIFENFCNFWFIKFNKK